MIAFAALRIRTYATPEPRRLSWAGKWVKNWFSNFDPGGHPILYRGRRFDRLEGAFVAAKNPDALVDPPNARAGAPKIRFIDRVATEKDPGKVKRLGAPIRRGGLITPVENWDEICLAVMDAFLRQKWQPGTPAFDRLIRESRPIIEWNNWFDDRWGATLKDGKGRNALGLLLAIIADEYLATGKVSPGADEVDWPRRQAELIEKLNAYDDLKPVPVSANPKVDGEAEPETAELRQMEFRFPSPW